jgi:hypothetical protein
VLKWCIDVPKSSIERIRRKERAQYSRGAEAISEAKRSTHASAFASGWPSEFETNYSEDVFQNASRQGVEKRCLKIAA